jgi:hypothetical protein
MAALSSYSEWRGWVSGRMGGWMWLCQATKVIFFKVTLKVFVFLIEVIIL